jgi:ABC-2 type transport system ATP-binding protein
MDEADRLCDRVAIIDKGKIVVMNEPKRLKQGLGGSVISLRMAMPSTEPFRKLKYVEDSRIADSTVFLTVKEPNKHLQEILKLAGDVESVELRSPTLNDVFLHYAGREFREDSPEGGFFERMMTARGRR